MQATDVGKSLFPYKVGEKVKIAGTISGKTSQVIKGTIYAITDFFVVVKKKKVGYKEAFLFVDIAFQKITVSHL